MRRLAYGLVPFALIAMAPGMLGSTVATATTERAAAAQLPAAKTVNDPVWLQQLILMLCRMFEEWGGTCGELTDANKAMEVVASTYQTIGFPSTLTDDERAALIDTLNEIDDMLSGTLPEGVDAATAANFRALIPGMIAALTPAN